MSPAKSGSSTNVCKQEDLKKVLFTKMFLSLVFSSLVSAQSCSIPYSSENCLPQPFYSYAPNYDVNGCDPLDTPISSILGTPQGILPLIMTSEANAANVIASGSIELKDGCSFNVVNFTFTGGASTTNIESFWFGSYQDASTSEGVILSDSAVLASSTQTRVTYELKQTKGLQVSYKVFNQFRLYTKNQLHSYGPSKNNQESTYLFVAYANIPLVATTSRAPAQKNSIGPGMSTRSSSAISLISTISSYISSLFLFATFAV